MKKTLYISRRLLNYEEVRSWAKEQGFTHLLAPGTIHVTIVYSKEPVDWDQTHPITEEITATGGPRYISLLGDYGKATVLRFDNPHFQYRWKQLKSFGAFWDYPDYKPHITLSYQNSTSIQLSAHPYLGPLIFGPEHFSEVKTNWQSNVQEVSLKSTYWQKLRYILNH